MAMNVKTTITLQEHYLRYAEKMVEEGVFPSISSVVEAGLVRIMHGDILAGPLAGMADEISRRMELPQDQWISTKDENLFDRVRARIAAR
jgi:antitoxin ParD1/3/4